MRKEEDFQVGALERHALDHPGALYEIHFAEGDTYLCRWVNGEYCDNDEDVDSSTYDEWYELDYEVKKTLKNGPNKDPRYDFIQVSRKHMPSLVMCGKEIVFGGSAE